MIGIHDLDYPKSDASGKVIKRYDYEPYGAVVGGQVADGPGYTGHVSDSATRLSYMQQRYMDPQLGVFLSVDPVTAYSNPVGMFNRYRYAANNPYKFTDPDGRCYTSTGKCTTEAEFEQAWRGEGARILNVAGGALGTAADLANGDVKGAVVNVAISRLVPGGKGGARVAGLALNNQIGKAAERLAAKELITEGEKIVGSHVAARTSSGLRVIDHLIERAGKLIGVEVKAGNGVRNASQLAKDAEAATMGAVLTGKNAPPELRGQKVIIETIERRYPK